MRKIFDINPITYKCPGTLKTAYSEHPGYRHYYERD